MLGRRVRALNVSEVGGRGPVEITWDGQDDSGHPLPAGAYFLRVEGPVRSEAIRVVKLSAR
jgi:flagellar hook assembly protein FlgD